MSASDLPTITSTRNRRIVEIRKLTQRKHRERQGRFLVEGLQLVHMGLDAGVPALEALYCEELFAGQEAPALVERLASAGTETAPVSRHVMESLCERDAPQGLVAVFPLLRADLGEVATRDPGLLLIVDRLQDPGNLGTLIRTADAVGALGVVLIEPCVDPYDPKTVRATMGSVFNLPVVRTRDVDALFAWARSRVLLAVGADAHLGIAWGQGSLGGGVALVLGNEARGISDDVCAHIRAWAHLPMIGRAESLNVAVAGGVLMYAWLRANRGYLGDPPHDSS